MKGREYQRRIDQTFTPPGFPIKEEKSWFRLGLLVSAAVSCIIFLIRYMEEINMALDFRRIKVPAGSIVKIADFVQVADGVLIPFYILAVLCLSLMLCHYIYFFRGAKSIYVMRRLAKKELYRRVAVLPGIGFGITAAAAVLLLTGFFAVYMAFTPEEWLNDGQWQRLWGEIV